MLVSFLSSWTISLLDGPPSFDSYAFSTFVFSDLWWQDCPVFNWSHIPKTFVWISTLILALVLWNLQVVFWLKTFINSKHPPLRILDHSRIYLENFQFFCCTFNRDSAIRLRVNRLTLGNCFKDNPLIELLTKIILPKNTNHEKWKVNSCPRKLYQSL